jgi:chemotaxis family two-component system response regulator Rcp1
MRDLHDKTKDTSIDLLKARNGLFAKSEAPSPSEPVHYRSAGEPTMDRVRLLLVEDNPSDVRLFQILLKEITVPYELKVLEDGQEATDYILGKVAQGEVDPPHLIFLDLNLPRKDGRAVLEEIKAKAIVREIPVIVFTGSKDPQDVQTCYDLHANCYLTKPSNLRELKSIIHVIENFWFDLVKLPQPTFPVH